MKPLLLLLVPLMYVSEVAAVSQTPPTPDQTALSDGNNAFAVDLYSQLRKQPGNLFFSPESISTAFAMAYAGASGQTASQMAARVGMPVWSSKTSGEAAVPPSMPSTTTQSAPALAASLTSS